LAFLRPAYATLLNETDGVRRTLTRIGIVVNTPIPNNAQPAPLRVSLRSLSPINRPKPTPSATRVPAISMSSGIVKLCSRIGASQVRYVAQAGNGSGGSTGSTTSGPGELGPGSGGGLGTVEGSRSGSGSGGGNVGSGGIELANLKGRERRDAFCYAPSPQSIALRARSCGNVRPCTRRCHAWQPGIAYIPSRRRNTGTRHPRRDLLLFALGILRNQPRVLDGRHHSGFPGH